MNEELRMKNVFYSRYSVINVLHSFYSSFLILHSLFFILNFSALAAPKFGFALFVRDSA